MYVVLQMKKYQIAEGSTLGQARLFETTSLTQKSRVWKKVENYGEHLVLIREFIVLRTKRSSVLGTALEFQSFQ